MSLASKMLILRKKPHLKTEDSDMEAIWQIDRFLTRIPFRIVKFYGRYCVCSLIYIAYLGCMQQSVPIILRIYFVVGRMNYWTSLNLFAHPEFLVKLLIVFDEGIESCEGGLLRLRDVSWISFFHYNIFPLIFFFSLCSEFVRIVKKS